MLKIIKESIIFILFVIATMLFIAVIFYEYLPNTRQMPESIMAEALPHDIIEELNTNGRGQTTTRTFSTTVDLRPSESYVSRGRQNPFASVIEPTPAPSPASTPAPEATPTPDNNIGTGNTTNNNNNQTTNTVNNNPNNSANNNPNSGSQNTGNTTLFENNGKSTNF